MITCPDLIDASYHNYVMLSCPGKRGTCTQHGYLLIPINRIISSPLFDSSPYQEIIEELISGHNRVTGFLESRMRFYGVVPEKTNSDSQVDKEALLLLYGM